MWSFCGGMGFSVVHGVNFVRIEFEKSVNAGINRKITHK